MVETSKGLASLGYLGLTLGVAAIGAEALVVSPLLDDMAHEFGTVPGDLGTAVASYGFAVALSAPVLGYAGRYLPRITLMVASLAVFVLATLACGLVSSPLHLMLARAACGISAGGFLPSCYAFVADTVPYGRRAKVMGRIMFGWALSMVVGVPMGGLIGEWLGWRAAFVAVAAVAAVALLNVLLSFGTQGTGSKGDGSVSHKLPASVRGLFALTFLNMVSFYGVYTYLGTAVRAAQDIGSGGAAVYVLLYGAGLATSTLRGDLLDRIGKPRALQIALTALCPLFLSLTFVVGTPWGLAPLMVLWGVLQGAVLTGLTTVLTHRAEDARGLATAINSSITYLAVAVSAEVGGWSMAGWGGFSAICVGAAVGNGLASFLLATERTALAGRPAQHAKD